MSPTAGRVFTGLIHAAFRRTIFNHNAASAVSRLNNARPLALSSQRSAESADGDKRVKDEPIKFSTSKASHKTWKVDRAFGSQHQRPWWKVLPISLFTISFLLWCMLRGETDTDAQLEQQLFHHLPDLLSEEQEEEQNDSS